MKILVNGIGNIGTTMLGVLHRFKDKLGISHIYALKNHIQEWNKGDLDMLQNMGIEICTKEGIHAYTPMQNVIDSIDYIFDCTANGHGLKNKEWYSTLHNLKGCSAQGSEKGFGVPFMTGINANINKNEKYVQIVSCNTHSIAALLNVFAGPDLNQLVDADFVVVRRCEDIGNHERLVTANVVSRHLHSQMGTHHAVDALCLYNSMGLEPMITSSDVTTPSQLMHGVRFNIRLRSLPASINLVKYNEYVSTTSKFDSNIIFDQGRRYGFMGRIYSQVIIISNNLLYTNDTVKGWAFVPQEGNTILSSLHAYLLQTEHPKAGDIISELASTLIKPNW